MSHALVILCGGKSTRIGTDKALLPFGDCCLIEYLVRKFQPDFPKIYLSVQQKNRGIFCFKIDSIVGIKNLYGIIFVGRNLHVCRSLGGIGDGIFCL